MTRDVVVLDLDGTLLDTRARHHRVYAEAIAALDGRPMPLSSFWAAKRRAESWSRLLARTFGSDIGPDLQRAFLERFASRIEGRDMLALDRLHPGVPGALAGLRRAGLRPVLVTSRRKMGSLEWQLDALGLMPAFLSVVGTGGTPKHSAIEPGLAGRLVGWIGDTEEDFASARTLGVEVCLVTNGIRNRAYLGGLGPDRLATTIGGAIRAWWPGRGLG